MHTVEVVLVYRCGAAPDSNRVPIFSLRECAGTNTTPCILGKEWVRQPNMLGYRANPRIGWGIT